ncbi:MAG: IPT/TIG domain-containing protein [Bacteroidetes bacterium]|nr:IPT/TIG domain-containing protein [Bacteroidota bacterium]
MTAPNISSITPNPVIWGQTLTITGTNLTGASSVTFGSVNCGPGCFTVNTGGTQITVAVPPMPAGTVYPDATSVQVTVPTQGTSNSVPITIQGAGVLNTITIKNITGLDTTKYTVWVAGFIQQPCEFLYLNTDGNFTASAGNFINVNNGLTVNVPNIPNMGNNRLVFLVTDKTTSPAALSPITGYTAYPFNGTPGVCPPGPYDIFEFGPNAQYDVSAVDSFGLNLSFTVTNDSLVYGAIPAISRIEIGEAFTTFTGSDPLGSAFAKLLYTSPTGTGYPDSILDQFSAIVSPKDWLAIHPNAEGLRGYWKETIHDFFKEGNQLDIHLNAATVGNYSGSSSGTEFKLEGPNKLKIIIPLSDFASNQGFVQAVRGINSGEAQDEYDAFSQIEAAIFQAISRGVLLDGVVAKGGKITKSYTSNAWTNIKNWFSNHNNAYNGKPSVYDAYAKFFHCAKYKGSTIMGQSAGSNLGMAYGFSLDEDPNVGNWPSNSNVPAKTNYSVGSGQDVTLTVGRWLAAK